MSDKAPLSRPSWKRQWVSVLLGAALGWMLSPALPQQEPTTWMLWGAVLVGTLSNLGQFRRAGAVLTRRKAPLLNLLVGLGLPLLVFLLLFLTLR